MATSKEIHRLQAQVTLEFIHEPEKGGAILILASDANPATLKKDSAALREFAEFLGLEARGPLLKVLLPRP